MNSRQSLSFNIVKWISIVMVVFIHSGGNKLILDKPYPGWTVYFVKLFSDTIPAVAVPSFFLISGYLFYLNGKDSYAVKLRKRMRSLFIPYLIWNVLSIIAHGVYFFKHGDFNRFLLLCKEGGWDLFWGAYEFPDTHLNLFGCLIQNSGPIDFALWYVRNLMILILLSPFIKLFVTRCRIISWVFFSLLYLGELCDPFPGISSLSLFYYALGMWLFYYKKDFCESFCKRKVAVFLLLPYFFLLYLITFTDTIYVLRLLCIIIAVYLLFTFSFYGLSPKLGTLNLHMDIVVFVYFSHVIFWVSIVETLLDSILGGALLGSIIGYCLVPFVTILILTMVYFLLKWKFPLLLSFLLGK